MTTETRPRSSSRWTPTSSANDSPLSLSSAGLKPGSPAAQKCNSRLPHLDGLRAVAILAVLLYHFEIKPFGGGFVGVDVFLVLSGFLMTRKLRSDIQHDPNFALAAFYRARFWRLYPASATTIALTLIAALRIFPRELHLKVASSALAAATMTSNVLFGTEVGGYFDEGTILKPLLHTWSLALEEQFYLIWPFIIFITTSKPSGIKPFVDFSGALYVLFFCSFVSCLVLSGPSGYPTFAWFHLPTRLHEFIVGAWTSMLYNRASKMSIPLSTAISTVGLACIFGSTVLLDRSSEGNQIPFPGLASLPCLLGSAAVILTPQSLWSAHWCLSSSPLGYVGKVSYSVYLVHWPVWVFLVYWTGNREQAFVAALATAVLGIALHYLVEQKMRRASAWRMGYTTLVVLTTFVGVGAALYQTQTLAGMNADFAKVSTGGGKDCESHFNDSTGSPVRPRALKTIEKNQLPLSSVQWMDWDPSSKTSYIAIGENQTTSPPRIVVVGDSYGEICPVVGGLNPGHFTLCLTQIGCWIGLSPKALPGERCKKEVDDIRLALLKSPRGVRVFLTLRWEAREEQNIGYLLDWFKENGFIDVVVVGSHPHGHNSEPRTCLTRKSDLDQSIECREVGPTDPDFLKFNNIVKRLSAEREFAFADLAPSFSPRKDLNTTFEILCDIAVTRDLKGHFDVMGYRLAANTLVKYSIPKE